MARTYLDSGVLLACVQGDPEIGWRAVNLLSDNSRQFVSSTFLQLEIIPQAVYFRRADELQFYESFFRGVVEWALCDGLMLERGLDLACRYGLGGLDALHLRCALDLGAENFFTMEKPSKPLFRATGIRVLSLAHWNG